MAVNTTATSPLVKEKVKDSGPSRSHPHAGARFPNGSWGYIADPTLVRNRVMALYHEKSAPNASDNNEDGMLHFLPLKEHEIAGVCDTPPFLGQERTAWDLLTKKIQVGGPDPQIVNATNRTRLFRSGPNPPRVFCGVYTHEARHDVLEAIGETWGWRCDGFLGFSTKTDSNIGAIDLSHQGPEAYNNIWQKIRSVWVYIHDYYLDEYDYFHLSGDDNHFILENMKNYLWSLDHYNHTRPFYLGHHYKTHGIVVCGGGAGYTLNNVALKRFVHEAIPTCQVNTTSSSEDYLMGFCLRKIGIRCHDTADARGEQRYCGLDPKLVATNDGSHFFFHKLYNLWAETHGWKTQDDLVSSQHVAFHKLHDPIAQKRIHAIIYQSCVKGTTLGDALKRPVRLT